MSLLNSSLALKILAPLSPITGIGIVCDLAISIGKGQIKQQMHIQRTTKPAALSNNRSKTAKETVTSIQQWYIAVLMLSLCKQLTNLYLQVDSLTPIKHEVQSVFIALFFMRFSSISAKCALIYHHVSLLLVEQPNHFHFTHVHYTSKATSSLWGRTSKTLRRRLLKHHTHVRYTSETSSPVWGRTGLTVEGDEVQHTQCACYSLEASN